MAGRLSFVIVYHVYHLRQNESQNQGKSHGEHQGFGTLPLRPFLPAREQQPSNQIVNYLHQFFCWAMKAFTPSPAMLKEGETHFLSAAASRQRCLLRSWQTAADFSRHRLPQCRGKIFVRDLH